MNIPNFKLDNQDCLTWLSSQGEGSFQLIVLDPPYNVGFRYSQYRDSKPSHEYLYEQLLVLAKCERLLKPGGSLFYLNYPEFAAEVWGRVDFLKKVEIRPWVYNSHLGGAPLRRSSRQWLWFSKGNPLINQEAFLGEYRNPEDPRIRERIQKGLRPTVYDWIKTEPVKNSSREKRNHPCQIPEKMLEEIILGTTSPGDLVGDCYSGSGTTAISTIRHNRRFAGCEIDPAYVQVAKDAVIAMVKAQEPAVTKQSGSKELRSAGQSDQITPILGDDMEKHLNDFLKDLSVRNYSPYTLQKYAICLRKFLVWIKGKGISDLSKVGKEELKAYAETVTHTPEISISYVVSNIRVVKLFFRYLKKTGVILFDLSLVLKEPKQPKTLPKEPLTAKEVKAMLEAPDLRTPLGIRDRAILETFYSTGIRLQEMINLTLADLDLTEGLLFVREGKWKKDRTVPLGKHACLFIKAYLEAPRNLLIDKNRNPEPVKTNRVWISKRGKPLGKMDIGNLVRSCRKKAGIAKEITPHAFRRTLAVELIRNDCDFLAVKEILGHSKSETTLRYCALSGIDLKEAHKKSHPSGTKGSDFKIAKVET